MSSFDLADKKTFIILNPVAGRLDSKMVRQRLVGILEEHRMTYEIIETCKGDDLHKMVEDALGGDFERFIAVGGDGTVSGAASGLTGTDIPLIIIPTGTSNALAKFLEIPVGTEDSFSWWLSESLNKVVDAMQVDHRHFFLNVSLGFSSNTLKVVNRQEKRRLGSLIYLLTGLQRLVGISNHSYQVTIDGGLNTRRCSEVVIANMGIAHFDPIRLNPEIRMDDGKLSVCFIRAKNLLDYLRIFGSLISRQKEKSSQLECKDAFQSIEIEVDQRLPIQADGEVIGYTPVKVDLIPSAASFKVPA